MFERACIDPLDRIFDDMESSGTWPVESVQAARAEIKELVGPGTSEEEAKRRTVRILQRHLQKGSPAPLPPLDTSATEAAQRCLNDLRTINEQIRKMGLGN